jgi:predicted metal-dependent hydrolase
MSDYNLSRLIAAINKFNEGDYFECHEILEDIWFDVRDGSRNFYQGLLHISVAFYHLTKKNNFKGTIIQLNKALDKLNSFDEQFQGIDLLKLNGQLKRILLKLKKKEVPKRLPKIIMQ